MAEQREAREIIAEKLEVRFSVDKWADEILAALAAEGWSVERLEQVGWREGPASTTHGYVLNIEPTRDDSEPVYRVISPSTREADDGV